MSSFRPSMSLRPYLTRPLLRTPRHNLPSLSRRTYAGPKESSGDYGSGSGSPVGENPQDQGPNPSADKEHPGPPPPKAGQGSGSSPTKGTEKGHNIGDQKRSFSTVVGGRWAHGKGTEGAQPKILNESPPKEGEESEEVRVHNEEMRNRSERADAKVSNEDAEKDKVSKGFWSGHGGTAEGGAGGAGKK